MFRKSENGEVRLRSPAQTNGLTEDSVIRRRSLSIARLQSLSGRKQSLMPVIAPVESFFDAHLLAVAWAAGIEPSDIVKTDRVDGRGRQRLIG